MNIDTDKPLVIELKKSKLEVVVYILKILFRLLLVAFVVILIIGSFTEGEQLLNKDFSTVYKDWYGNTITSTFENNESIAFIPITGTILNEEMASIESGTTSEMTIKMLHDAQENPNIKAVVLRIDSPGGTVIDSEKIAQKINEVKKKKKVYALMESMAASGGYYIASQADKVFAYEETLTGSIGVIMQIPNAKELMDKVGVKMYSITSGNMKTMGSPFETFTPETQAVFQNLVNESYEGFVNRVASGRNMDKEVVKKLADGRIYSGRQALKNGLIDGDKGIDSLKEELKKEGLENALLEDYYIPLSPFQEILSPLGAKIRSFIPQSSAGMVMYYKMF